jgi:hypothetical protein
VNEDRLRFARVGGLVVLWLVIAIGVLASLRGRVAPAFAASAFLGVLSLPLLAILARGPQHPAVAPRTGPAPYLFVGIAFLALAGGLILTGSANPSVGLFVLLAAYSFALARWLHLWDQRARAAGLRPRRRM